MNELFLFLIIFFSIVGVVKTMSVMYTFIVRWVYYAVRKFRKEENDIKIWMKF